MSLHADIFSAIYTTYICYCITTNISDCNRPSTSTSFVTFSFWIINQTVVKHKAFVCQFLIGNRSTFRKLRILSVLIDKKVRRKMVLITLSSFMQRYLDSFNSKRRSLEKYRILPYFGNFFFFFHPSKYLHLGSFTNETEFPEDLPFARCWKHDNKNVSYVWMTNESTCSSDRK